ncbi:hypothetical protein GCM10007908_05180 [Rhizobium albus]|nr:hypothetical protein GCM10007908_05180 [Rhizobium albus]
MTQLLKQEGDIGQVGTPGGMVAPSYTKVALVSTLKAGRGQGQSDISAWTQRGQSSSERYGVKAFRKK